VKPDGVSSSNESALSVASRVCDWSTVRLLLEFGANPEPLEWTPLMRAIVLGSIEDVEAELEDYMGLNGCDRWERSPWLLSVCSGELRKAQLLTSVGGNVSAVGRCGKTCLQYAVLSKSSEMVEWLLSIGIDPNIRDQFGCTALMEAAAANAFECANVLIQGGADVQATNDRIGEQAINRCAMNLQLIKLLLGAGADIDQISGGSWLLKDAAESGDVRLAQALVELGAKVNNTSSGGTALHAAVAEDALNVMQFLIAAGTDLQVWDGDGECVLSYVQSTEAAKMLLDANLVLTDEEKKHVLATQADEEIRTFIEEFFNGFDL
jgi:ankyrin repeat protein